MLSFIKISTALKKVSLLVFICGIIGLPIVIHVFEAVTVVKYYVSVLLLLFGVIIFSLLVPKEDGSASFSMVGKENHNSSPGIGAYVIISIFGCILLLFAILAFMIPEKWSARGGKASSSVIPSKIK